MHSFLRLWRVVKVAVVTAPCGSFGCERHACYFPATLRLFCGFGFGSGTDRRRL